MRPTLHVISDELITRILDEAKRILSEIGVEVRGPLLRQRLLDFGLKLDAAGERISFPPEVVEDAIATAPRAITLYNRNGEPHAELSGDNVHFVPGSSGLKVLDHRTGETRLAKTENSPMLAPASTTQSPSRRVMPWRR